MGLLDLSGSENRELVKQLINKTKKVKKSATTVTKSGSLITRIKNICDQVQKRLGHYAQELELIQDDQTLSNYIDACIENNMISIDTETTGLDPICDQIVGVCIHTYNQKAAYIPINHISYITNTKLQGQLSVEQVAKQLQRLVDNNVKIIMFNAKFDIRVIRHQLGVYLTPSWCGFIASKCLKNNEEEENLKYLWKKYCSQNKDAEHFTFDKMFEGLKFNLIPITTAYLYASNDAKMTTELYDFQKEYLNETNEKCISCNLQKVAKLYKEIELPIIPIVADIEDQGVALDVAFCEELSKKYNEKLQQAEQAFQKELQNYQDQINAYINTHPQTKLENPINISSPTQLAELFYDVLQVPAVSRKTPRGTGEEILEKMGHPLGKLILEYRGIAKLINTYIDKMPEILNKKTGRIHCSYNQYGADCIVGSTVIKLKHGSDTIENICKSKYPNMQPNVFYDLDVCVINRYGAYEHTSHCIKFENVPTIKLIFNDGSQIQGTYDHPILCNNKFKHLKDIDFGDYVDCADFKTKLKVIGKEFTTTDVYDFKVPLTHSFVSNNVISHNTGRFSCISKGTLISCPKGDKHIEDVKCGDYVYSYSDSGILQLNKVKRVWYTGKKQCIKLYWKSKYNSKLKGTLVCTPDHYIKTTEGWIQAKDLNNKHSIYHVHRRINKNSVSLYGQHSQGNEQEHVWIKHNFFQAPKNMYIHHKDCNRLNNDPNNLQIVTPKEHINIHRQMNNGYCGAHDFTKNELIKMCEDVNWDVRKVKHDYYALKGWLKKHKINYIKEYTNAYNTRSMIYRSFGKPFKHKSLLMTKENLKYALELADFNINEAASYFGPNSVKFVEKCNKYKLLDNHNVYKIEHLDGYYDVYDLEVENAHCFIANELCVHNSSNPNLQNIPSRNEAGEIRKIFVATKEIKEDVKDNKLDLLIQDEVQTLTGWKNVEELTVNDIIICDDGNHKINNVQINGKQVLIEMD